MFCTGLVVTIQLIILWYNSLEWLNLYLIYLLINYFDKSLAVKEVMPELNAKSKLQYFCFGHFDPNTIEAKPLKQLIDESSSEEPSNLDKGNFNGL
jgi:hypothetical protein